MNERGPFGRIDEDFVRQDPTSRDNIDKLRDALNRSTTVKVLESAFKADPNAIHALMCNRVPCNQALADDPYISVDIVPVLSGGCYQIGALGLLNGILEANGLPKVAMKFSEEVDAKGRAKLLGFCEYKPAYDTATPVEHKPVTSQIKQE